MNKYTFVKISIVLLVFGIRAFGEESEITKHLLIMPAVENSEANMPVAAIYITPSHFRPPKPTVIATFWQDGKVIWSEEPIDGGPPYKEGQVEPEALKEALENFKSLGFFENPNANNQTYAAFDTSYTTIELTYEERVFRMSSWHEHVEKTGNRIETGQRTIRLEEGKTREEIWAAEASDEYKEFRLVWSEIKDTLLALIPTKEASSSDASFVFRKFEVKQSD